MLPGFGLFETTAAANILTWIGFAICISAATLQLVSDTQIHRFREQHPGQYCNVGVWKHGRHPNYFGEISMWWGVWTMYASILRPGLADSGPCGHDSTLPVYQHPHDGTAPAPKQAGLC